MGQSPESGGVSLRTFNRNFEGRSGTQDAQIYLVSPEVAAASALAGELTEDVYKRQFLLLRTEERWNGSSGWQ